MPSNGYVYIFHTNNKTKIGRAKRNPETRVRAIATQSGLTENEYSYEIFETGQYELVEKSAHKILKESNITGEYFSVSKDEAKSVVLELLKPIESEHHDCEDKIAALHESFRAQEKAINDRCEAMNDHFRFYGLCICMTDEGIVTYNPYMKVVARYSSENEAICRELMGHYEACIELDDDFSWCSGYFDMLSKGLIEKERIVSDAIQSGVTDFDHLMSLIESK